METVDTKGLFKRAFVKNRCIIPAERPLRVDRPREGKDPAFFAANGGILAFAGIWERWRDENGEEHHHPRSRSLHVDDPRAQPAIDGTAGKEVLMKAPPKLREWIVNRRMNKTGVGDDDPATASPFEHHPESSIAPAPKDPQGTLF